MLLCLDVGNTQIYGGIYNGKKFIHFFRFNTKRNKQVVKPCASNSQGIQPSVSFVHPRG